MSNNPLNVEGTWINIHETSYYRINSPKNCAHKFKELHMHNLTRITKGIYAILWKVAQQLGV